jgi:hypothetical protein
MFLLMFSELGTSGRPGGGITGVLNKPFCRIGLDLLQASPEVSLRHSFRLIGEQYVRHHLSAYAHLQGSCRLLSAFSS